MTKIKERLLGAILVMNEEQAEKLWEHLVWENIPEEEMDEWDKILVHETQTNPDCLEMASSEEVERVLGQI